MTGKLRTDLSSSPVASFLEIFFINTNLTSLKHTFSHHLDFDRDLDRSLLSSRSFFGDRDRGGERRGISSRPRLRDRRPFERERERDRDFDRLFDLLRLASGSCLTFEDSLAEHTKTFLPLQLSFFRESQNRPFYLQPSSYHHCFGKILERLNKNHLQKAGLPVAIRSSYL